MCCRYPKIGLILLFCASTAFADGIFRVRRSRGSIKQKSPLDFVWTNVGLADELGSGNLISLEYGAKILLEWTPKYRPAGAQARITIAGPLVLRLRPENLKKISSTPYFLPSLPSVAGEIDFDDKGDSGSLDVFFKQAYQPTTQVLVDVSNRTKQFVAQQVALFSLSSVTESAAIQLRYKPITIIYPQSESYFLAESFPFQQRIVWSKPADQVKKYGLYLWTSKMPRPSEPNFLADSEYYNLIIKKPGDYFLQVESEDKIYQSPVHALSFDENILEKLKATASSSRVFEFPYPIEEQVVRADKYPIQFRLKNSWFEKHPDLNLVVVDLQSHKQQIYKVNESSFNKEFLPGKYVWTLQNLKKEVLIQPKKIQILKFEGIVALDKKLDFYLTRIKSPSKTNSGFETLGFE